MELSALINLIENIDSYENKTIFYHVKDKLRFKDKTLAIAGGGDSAVDWAIELSKNLSKIFLFIEEVS